MLAYNNYKKNVEKHNAKIITSPDEFIKIKKVMEKNLTYEESGLSTLLIEIECENGHRFNMKFTSLRNKLNLLDKNDGVEASVNICAECDDIKYHENKCKEACERLNFKFIGYDNKTRNSTHVCVCGIEYTNSYTYLVKVGRTSGCVKCLNSSRKTNFEVIRKIFSDGGCKLLSEESDYKDKETRLKFECNCGTIAYIKYQNFKNGERCYEVCKAKKYEETCKEKYGFKNAFMNEDIKAKSRQTCVEKYGVPHVMQNKEIKQQSEKTCVEKYGVKWAFTLPEVYERIHAICLEKYGVKYPLQSKSIQDKIELVFMKNWGARRPFMSDEFVKKYNKMMLDKYGKEWFVETDKFKEVMTKVYGAPSPLQCPLLFKKAMENSFKKKIYISDDGKSWSVLGYEDKCIKDLIDGGLLSEKITAGNDDGIPVCPYEFEGTKHIWYPDIWISEGERIIEVKSTWTYDKNPEKMKAKMFHCKYNCELWVYDEKKCILDIVMVDKDTKEVNYLCGKKFVLGEYIKESNKK
jgi:hypothetical protein